MLSYLGLGFFVYLVVGLMFFFNVIYYSSPLYIIFDLSSIRLFEFFSLSFFFDYYSYLYLFVLFSIVSSIHLFMFVYMHLEVKLFRFFLILKIFVVSMVILILSPNLISLMLGWDGLGFSSFLLVAWFGCFSSRFSSLKTFMVKRFGDGLFLISLFFFFIQGHFCLSSLDFLIVFVGVFIIFSLFTKSAHFPFSSWLPDAMAAPTPVSALVHSSTLVTAGLYLLFRFSYLLSFELVELVSYLGLWTLFMGSFGGCFDYNSKKIVAYSTVSQLGFMSFVLGLGCFDLCFYYMMVHALFKALLFISVGCFLVLKFHNQDMRHLNKCWSLSPFVTFCFFFSCFSLSGFPFFSGFYMKEIIVNSVGVFQLKYFLQLIFFLSIIFTVIYTFRLFNLVALGYQNSYGSFFDSGKIKIMVFFFLFVCILNLGIMLYKDYKLWVKFGSSLVILFYSGFGVFLSFFVFRFWLYGLFDMISYFLYMFFLNVVSVSFNKLYVVGGFFSKAMDSGFFLFSFINQLKNFLKVNLKKIFAQSFVLKWLSLMGLSFFFICLVCFI